MADEDILIEFGDPKFDPDQFTKDWFIKKSEEKVRVQFNELVKTKENAADELKRSVYQNYPCFISTSKEISNLEVDMLDLRNLLTDMGSVLKGMQHMQLKFDMATQTQRPVSRHMSQTQFRDKKVAPKEDVKWLLGVPEELDVMIAERLFDNAVDVVTRVRTLLQDHPQLEVALSSHPIKAEIDNRIARLSETLAVDLQTPTIRPAYVRVCISRMLRLGLADSAKSIFLESRSKKIRTEIRKLKFEGDIALYVGELSKLVFTSILSTCEEYRQSFTHTSMISGFVVWAMRELQSFGEMFQRQVFVTDNFQVIGQCLQIAEYHCKMLEQKGLSLAFQLWQHIHPGLASVVDEYLKRLNLGLSKHISDEQWVPKLQWVYYDSSLSDRSALHLTDSAIFLNTSAQRFANDLCWVLSPDLLPTVCSALSALLEGYMHKLADRLLHLGQAPPTNISTSAASVSVDKQQLAIVGNAVFVVEDLAPRLSVQIKDKLKRPVKELDRMCKKLEARHISLRDTYCIQRARDILDNKMDWSHMDYSGQELEESVPSPRFVKLVKYLAEQTNAITTLVGPQSVTPIIARIVAEVAAGMSHGGIWEHIEGEAHQGIGYGGLQQLVLDCKYFMVATGNYLIDEAVDAMNSVIERAVVAYCSKTGQGPQQVLKKEEWFQDGVQNAVATASVP